MDEPAATTIAPAAQVHYRVEFSPGVQWLWPYLILGLGLTVLVSPFAYTAWVSRRTDALETAGWVSALTIVVLALILWIRIRFGRRLSFEVVHAEHGATLYARFRTRGGRTFHQCAWDNLREVRYEFRFRDVRNKRGVSPAFDSFDADGRRQPLFGLWDPFFRDFVIPKPDIEKLAAEINRQQDGSWRNRPLILSDADDAKFDTPVEWDESAAVPTATDRPAGTEPWPNDRAS